MEEEEEKAILYGMDAYKKWRFTRFTPPVPNHHPSKMDVLPKTVVLIILAAKW